MIKGQAMALRRKANQNNPSMLRWQSPVLQVKITYVHMTSASGSYVRPADENHVVNVYTIIKELCF